MDAYTYALSADPAGILFDTVEVTHGPQPGALMIDGSVNTERLQGNYVCLLYTSELQVDSEKYRETIKKYSTRESKWSGNIVVDDDKCRAEKIAGRKQWNCDILLKSTASDKVIIHEHLHACSGSYLTPLTIIPYSSMEEGSVELLAREICRAEGIPRCV